MRCEVPITDSTEGHFWGKEKDMKIEKGEIMLF